MKDNSTNSWFPAFTLSEVMVTLVITSILILTIYAFLGMLKTYFSRIHTTNEIYSERLGFNTVFSQQWDEADSVCFKEKRLSFWRQGTENTWYFGDSTGVMHHGFWVVFHTGPCRIYSTPLKSGKNAFLNTVIAKFRITWDEGKTDSMSFYYQKSYTPELLINR